MGLTEEIERAHFRFGILPPRKINQDLTIKLKNTSQFMELVYNIYRLVAKNNLNLGHGINYHPKSFALRINEERIIDILCPLTKKKLTGKEWEPLQEKIYTEARKIKYGPEIINGSNPLPFTMTFNDYKNTRNWPNNFIL